VRDLDLDTVARESMSASLRHNPRTMTEADVAALLREAL
jgi:alcohol dehydrogenase class IV